MAFGNRQAAEITGHDASASAREHDSDADDNF
jgi:hypothetical protein